MRPAQSSKPATYRCPFCGGRLHAMSAHTLIAPEGDAERRRHAHTECVLAARKAGTLPTYDDWRATQPRRPGLLARLSSLFVVALLAGCGSSSHAPSTAQSRPTFAYDATAPLHYVDHGRINRSGEKVAVHDVVFRSGGQLIEGFLVLPRGEKRRRPAVIFVHGSGGDRSELFVQAVRLAERGIVTLTITAPSTSYPATQGATVAASLANVDTEQVRDVVAVRRAVDLLRSLPQVDPARIGYLGWSAGAKTGTFVAASDPRVKALALLSAGALPVSVYVARAPARYHGLVRHALTKIDPIRYARRARPGSLLLLDGKRDQVVPRAALENIIHAAPHGTTVHWYDAPHELNAAAYNDAFDWLQRRLAAAR